MRYRTAIPQFPDGMGDLFATFSVLLFTGMALFGVAILASSLLPPWLGWVTLLYSVVGLTIQLITGDSLLAMHHLMPVVLGTALLLS